MDQIKIIELFGEVVVDETLSNLQKQAGDVDKFHTLVVKIASPGGSVAEGLDIMVWLNSLSAQGKEIITIVVANAYSIASLIMLAADYKVISKHGKVMVHNPMIPELEYVNANELEKYIKDLRELEEVMYVLYGAFTGLKREQIKVLMDAETFLDPEEAVKHGFADSVVDIKPKSYEMAVKQKVEINMSKTMNILHKVIGMVNGADFVNQLYYDEAGAEITIHQQDPSTYKVGDKTSVEAGEVKLSDGVVLTIEDSEIKDVNRDTQATSEPIEETPGDLPSTEEIIGEPVVETPATEEAADFNVGPAPAVEEPTTEVKQKGDMPAKVVETTESTITTKETEAKVDAEATIVGEYALADGRKMVVGEDGVAKIVEVTPEAVVEAPAVEPPVANKEYSALEEEMKKQMEALQASFDEKLQAISTKVDKNEEIQEVAVEAIDAIASSTSSGFKPSAKATVEVDQYAGMTIFQKLKAKAQAKQ